MVNQALRRILGFAPSKHEKDGPYIEGEATIKAVRDHPGTSLIKL